MIRVVLDTNIVVSAHLNASGLENGVFKLAIKGLLELYVSEPILDEYARVLHSPKFSLDPPEVSKSLAPMPFT